MADEVESLVEEESLTKSVLKRSFWNFLTTSISRFGAVIFTILIARILQPELYGLYGLATSVMSILLTFADLGVNATLMRYVSLAIGAKDKEKVSAYFHYLLKIKIILTMFFALILLVISYPLSVYIFKKPDLAFPLAICSLYLILLSLIGICETVFYTMQQIKYISIKETLSQAMRIILPVLLIYWLANKLVGVIVGLMLASFIVLIFLFILILKKYSFLFEKANKISKKEKKSILSYLVFLTLGSITSVFFSSVDMVMLGAFVQSAYIGYYKAAFSIATSIAGFISISYILVPTFTQLEGKKLERAFNKAFHYSAMLAFPCAFGIILIAKPFISLIYGESYISATIPLFLLSFLIIESVLGSLFSWAYNAKGKPKIPTKILMTALILNIILNYALIVSLLKFGQIYAVLGAAIAITVSRYFNSIALAIKAKKHLGIRLQISSITKPLIASVIMFAALAAFQGITKLIWPYAVVEILFGAFFYFVVMVLIKGIGKEDFELIRGLRNRT